MTRGGADHALTWGEGEGAGEAFVAILEEEEEEDKEEEEEEREEGTPVLLPSLGVVEVGFIIDH